MRAIQEALEWANSIQMRAPVSEHHKRAVEELWNMVGPLGVETALEVGTGEPPGLMVRMLQEHGICTKGLDVLSACDVPGDMHNLPFPDASFDLVCSRHSLEHVLIPYVALREMIRVSKRYLLVVVPVDSPKALNWPDHLNVFGRAGWENIFRHLRLTVRHFEQGDHTEEYARDLGLWTDLEWRWLLVKEGK